MACPSSRVIFITMLLFSSVLLPLFKSKSPKPPSHHHKPPNTKPPLSPPIGEKPLINVPPTIGKPLITVPPVNPPIMVPPVIGYPPVTGPPVIQSPPVGGSTGPHCEPPALAPANPPIAVPPVVENPPITVPPVIGYPPVMGSPAIQPPPVACPPPALPPANPPPESCPADSLKRGACVDLLGGLVHIGLGDQVVNQCCPLLQGLVELEAPVCLCTTIKLKHLDISIYLPLTAIKLKHLDISIYLPLALQLLLTFGKAPPPGYTCTL